jgi:hypothetical protein
MLAGLSPAERVVRVTHPGAASAASARSARALLDRLGLRTQTDALVLNPVRLQSTVVRPAAISPLERWVVAGGKPHLGSCRARDCPLLVAGGSPPPSSLGMAGAHLRVIARGRLRSAAPLGFVPSASAGGDERQPPLLIGGDPRGLAKLPGLEGIYRSDSWSAELPAGRIHSWDLSDLRRRLQRAAVQLASRDGAFTLDAPSRALAQAAAAAHSAPRRLLLVAGGGLAVLGAFVVLLAGALRRDAATELERMRVSGASPGQRALFAFAEAATPSGVGVVVGTAVGVVATALLAGSSGVPVGGALMHSLLTPLGAAVALGGFAAATLLLGSLLLVPPMPSPWRLLGLADLLAVGATAGLVFAIVRGGSASASDPLPALLVPLSCLAAGVLAYRLADPVMRGAERLSRRAPLGVRLALVNLARSPYGPSLAVAFLTITVALGGFAVIYRATLLQGVADQAAERVPLDATVTPGRSLVTPLQAAPLSRWRVLAGGDVLPVDRTEASYPVAGQTTTVPAIGLPAAGLELLHGWRGSDASAPRSQLTGQLRWPGQARNPGPGLSRTARSVSVAVFAPGAGVAVSAELRDREGAMRTLGLGETGPRHSRLTAPLPRGRWELESLELDEPAGLAATNGHQLAENPAARTRFSTRLRIGPVEALGGRGRVLARVPIAGWRAVGAADRASPRGQGLSVRFVTSGAAGVVRPVQPSDSRPLPILVDPETAGAAGAGGQLPLSVNGVALRAHVVGVLRRFPTLASNATRFVVADQAQLEGAVDAAEPAAGQPNELWLSTSDPSRLRTALSSPRLSELNFKFRSQIEQMLRSDPVARGLLGAVVAAAAIALLIACLGVIVVLLGSGRDPALERDLITQGLGPAALRAELQVRVAAIAGLGIVLGLIVAVALARLAVGTVRGAVTLSAPRPPLVTVVPWIALLAWSVIVGIAIWLSAWRVAASPGRER